ncbi:metallo-beta-lactamase domain protein [Purpureocillium lavendulum]|uniref:Metallo-beta-lactamase domain protein n=1 Tax=Purpureocillium lavendulum TaxID=1247861 RepID=A0AB34FWP6_9HYPO|nr:metallo-beta-lactamase domain protein [Purpureocillium lavendulum]
MICSSCRAALRAAPRRTVATPRSLSTATAATSSRALARTSQLSSSSLRPVAPLTTSRPYSSATPPPPPPRQRQGAEAEAQAIEVDEDPLPAMTPTEASIAAVLSEALDPTFVLVQDVSGGCGSMYAIQVASRAFRGQTLLKQQRMVNAALGDRVKEWHGVQIRTVVPADDE